MWKSVLLVSMCLAIPAFGATRMTAPQLTELSRSGGPALREAIVASFDAKDLKDGKAWTGLGPDFFFAIQAAAKPTLLIDNSPGPQMRHLGDDLWYAPARIDQVGKLHSFFYLVNGAKFGGRLNMPAFGPLAYLQPGVPTGKLSGKLTYTSYIYDGMKSDYWIYVPAEYDPKTPAALMVFQDGGGYTHRHGSSTLNVIDNLIYQKKIPVMICVFTNPGDISGEPNTP